MIDSHKILTEIEQQGFSVIKGILSSKDVDSLREYLDSFFSDLDVNEMNSIDFIENANFISIPFKEEVVGLFKSLLGERFSIFPNFTIRKDVFTPWHIDRGFVGKGNYLYERDFRALQCGIYLQDSSTAGLEVRPRSHNILIGTRFKNTLLSDIFSYVLSIFYKGIVVEAKAGDLIVWDCRLFHRGTKDSGNPLSKYAIYWSVSENNQEHTVSYLSHLIGRGKSESVVKTVSRERYELLGKVDFPNDFPNQIISIVKREGINVETIRSIE